MSIKERPAHRAHQGTREAIGQKRRRPKPVCRRRPHRSRDVAREKDLCQSRFLQRRCLSLLRYSDTAVHSHFCHFAHVGLVSPRHGTAREQSVDPADGGIHRARARCSSRWVSVKIPPSANTFHVRTSSSTNARRLIRCSRKSRNTFAISKSPVTKLSIPLAIALWTRLAAVC